MSHSATSIADNAIVKIPAGAGAAGRGAQFRGDRLDTQRILADRQAPSSSTARLNVPVSAPPK